MTRPATTVDLHFLSLSYSQPENEVDLESWQRLISSAARDWLGGRTIHYASGKEVMHDMCRREFGPGSKGREIKQIITSSGGGWEHKFYFCFISEKCALKIFCNFCFLKRLFYTKKQ
jgi:hypothetical protein